MMKKTAIMAAIALGMGLGAAQAAKITVWTDFTGGENEWLAKVAKNFEKTKEGQGNTIELVAVSLDDNRDKFIQAAPKGEGPDLIATIPHDRLGQFASAGVIEPMANYLSPKLKIELPESSIDAFSYNGRLFGMPMFGEAVAVIYNKKLLPGGVPDSWEAFLKTAQGLTDLPKQQFGFLAPIGIQYHMHGIYYAFGGYVFGKNKDGSYNVKDIGLGNEGAIKGAQLISDLRFKYKLIPEGADDYGFQQDSFLKGKAAMWLNGPWAMADIKKAGIDAGIDLLPKPTGAKRNWAPFIGIRGVIMNSYSKNKAVAAAFSNYLVDPAQQITLNQIGGRVPISRSAVRKLANDPIVKGFGAAISQGVPMPNIPQMGSVWEPWGNALSLTIKSDKADVASLHKAASEQILKAINK